MFKCDKCQFKGKCRFEYWYRENKSVHCEVTARDKYHLK